MTHEQIKQEIIRGNFEEYGEIPSKEKMSAKGEFVFWLVFYYILNVTKPPYSGGF